LPECAASDGQIALYSVPAALAQVERRIKLQKIGECVRDQFQIAYFERTDRAISLFER
jgi:hypothetical protein